MKRHVIIVDVGCTCRSSRRRMPKLSSMIAAFVRPKKDRIAECSSSTDSSTETLMADKKKRRRRGRGAVEEESEAVVKDSTQPYADFRDSILQMIVEKELYGWDELNDLLHRFLALNSPHHHHLIIGAFAEIWDGVFASSRG